MHTIIIRKIIPFLLVIVPTFIYACDVCGCGIGGFSSGVLPRLDQAIIGVGYQSAYFKHRNVAESRNGDSRVRQDQLHQTEVFLRLTPTSRWQILAQLPIAVHIREEDAGQSIQRGVGDIGFQAHYHLVNPENNVARKWSRIALAGFGAMLPTGNYQQRDMHRQMIPNGFQIGSGAWALQGHLNTIVSNDGKGIHLESRAQYHFANELNYQRGWFWSQGVHMFRNLGLSKQRALIPALGVQYEYYTQDTDFGIIESNTGGSFLNAVGRIDFISGTFNIGSFMSLPMNRKVPDAQPLRHFTTGFQLMYLF